MTWRRRADSTAVAQRGQWIQRPDKSAYIRHLLSYIDINALKPLKIVVNAGNGGAGPIIDALEPQLPFHFHQDSPRTRRLLLHGIPNPLLPECRARLPKAVQEHDADLGLAWDGDFDQHYFRRGWALYRRLLPGWAAGGNAAGPATGSKNHHDPRLTWNTIDQVRAAGGIPVQSKTGHAFIKERMRQDDAIYGGEMSAHH